MASISLSTSKKQILSSSTRILLKGARIYSHRNTYPEALVIHRKNVRSFSSNPHTLKSSTFDLRNTMSAAAAVTTGAALIVIAAGTDSNNTENVAKCDAAQKIAANWPPGNSSDGPRRNVMLHRMRSVRARHLDDKYNVNWTNVIGEGAYGTVHPARLKLTGEKVALKKIGKKYTSSNSFRNETDALLRIYDNGGHPNISGLRDMYEDEGHFYLILDLVSGGEMFEHLIEYGAYSEADSARLMQEVASALAFLHGVGVVHADLKPENLLLCSKKKTDGTIKMIDFGCAVVHHDGDKEKTGKQIYSRQKVESTGTTAYWSPERFSRGAMPDKASDLWSVGVILFIMLCGVHPFDLTGTSTDEEIEERIKRDPTPPMGKLTDHLSPSAIDLIEKLMAVDPQERISAYEMFRHPWITGATASKSKIIDSDKKLSKFKELRNRLEAGIFAVLVANGHRDLKLSEAVVKDDEDNRSGDIMKRAFEVFDSGGKGFVSSNDLGRVVGQLTGSQLSATESDEMLLAALDAYEESTSSGNAPSLCLSDFSKLFSRLKHQHFPRGHILYEAGDTGDAMYFINAGKVAVETKKGQLVSILRAGDFFGEGCLLGSAQTRFTTAKCATPVDLIKITREEFDRYTSSSSHAKNDLRVKWRARSLKYAKNLIRLQTNVKSRVLEKGEVVYNEGDEGTSMYSVDDHEGGTLDVLHGDQVVHSYGSGDTFGETSLLFDKPRSSTVKCVSNICKLKEMKGSDFKAIVGAFPEMSAPLRDMCRKRIFKKAIKQMNREHRRGFGEADLIAAFSLADKDKNGMLGFDEIRAIMHQLDPNFPESEIRAVMEHIDIDEDGHVGLEEFKRIFRVFENMEK